MRYANFIIGIIVVLVLLIWYIIGIQFTRIETPKILDIDLYTTDTLKTGDLILFKAHDNFNSIYINCYFGHVGVVYVDPITGQQLIFEAASIAGQKILPDNVRTNGIFLHDLQERTRKYMGLCYLKRLTKPLDPDVINEFQSFIKYAMNNFIYQDKIALNAFTKLLGCKKCDHLTDCGQLVFLSLIKLGLLDIREYSVSRLNHLKYTCSVKKLSNNEYLPLIEICKSIWSDKEIFIGNTILNNTIKN